MRTLITTAITVLVIFMISLWNNARAAEILSPGCKLAWEYAAAEQKRIDGFRLLTNATNTEFPPEARSVTCEQAKVVNGANTVKLLVFAGEAVSPWSNALTFQYSSAPLVAPSNARIIIKFPTAAP